MNFNLTPLEWSVSIFVCLAIYIWTRHGRPPLPENYTIEDANTDLF